MLWSHPNGCNSNHWHAATSKPLTYLVHSQSCDYLSYFADYAEVLQTDTARKKLPSLSWKVEALAYDFSKAWSLFWVRDGAKF